MYVFSTTVGIIIVDEDPEAYPNIDLYPVDQKYWQYLDESWNFEIVNKETKEIKMYSEDMPRLKYKFKEAIKTYRKSALTSNITLETGVTFKLSEDVRNNLEKVKSTLENQEFTKRVFKFSDNCWVELDLDKVKEYLNKIEVYTQRCFDMEYHYSKRIDEASFDELFIDSFAKAWPCPDLTEV